MSISPNREMPEYDDGNTISFRIGGMVNTFDSMHILSAQNNHEASDEQATATQPTSTTIDIGFRRPRTLSSKTNPEHDPNVVHSTHHEDKLNSHPSSTQNGTTGGTVWAAGPPSNLLSNHTEHHNAYTSPPNKEHIRSEKNVPICTFFIRGKCRYGDRCRFRHDVQGTKPQVVDQLVKYMRQIPAELSRIPASVTNPAIISAFQATETADVQESELITNEEESQSNSIDTNQDKLEHEESHLEVLPLEQAVENATEDAMLQAEKLYSEDAECGICFELPAAVGRSFGLLPGCEHVFCLACIRAWRARLDSSKPNVRSCPLCRRESFFVVPSDRVVVDRTRKITLINNYKEKLGRIPCRYYDKGKGTCPFGTSCFYAHINADGTRQQLSRPRLRANADGELNVMQNTRLCDFL